MKPCEGNVCRHLAVHRAVAICFCKGYASGLVVDHKDGNKENNFYKNLVWCTQKENLKSGYVRRGDNAFRNHDECELYYKGKLVDVFACVKDAAMYAQEMYGYKFTMVYKHKRYKDVVLKKCND